MNLARGSIATRHSQRPVYILGLHNQARGLFPTGATLHRATLLGSRHESADRVTLPRPLGPARYMVQATNSSADMWTFDTVIADQGPSLVLRFSTANLARG